MLTSVGLEVMNSTNPELSWKSVTKGRRSKKSVARSLNSVVKVGNSISPKRVGDFSGSDSDKFGEVILGQATSGMSENVPLKKRRHLLQSPSPHPWASSLGNQDSAPSRTLSSSPLLEGRVQLQFPSCSSESEYDGAGDFSGIELLAAAASMDDGIDDAEDKKDLPEDSSIQKNSDALSSDTPSKQGLETNEPVNSLGNIDVSGGNVESLENNSAAATSHSISACLEDGTTLKVDRKYWDLNTPIDAWGEPLDASIAGGTLKALNESWHMVEIDKHIGDKSAPVPEVRICSKLPHLKENLLEPPNSIYSHASRDTSIQACDKDPDDQNSIQALNCDADMKELNPVTISDAIACSSGMLMSDGKINATSGTVVMIQDGDCSSNMSERERTGALDGSLTGAKEVNALDKAASESAVNVQLNDMEVSQKTLSPGNFTLYAQPVASTDSNKQIDGASNSTMADCEQYVEQAELGSKHDEDSNLPNEESNRTIMEDTRKSLNAGAQCESTSFGRIGIALDGRRGSDCLQDNRVGMVDGEDLTGFQEGYDSPYEDGELRGPFFYAWEDNEGENECVDYESDGRNGDGPDASDYLESEIYEAGRSLSLKMSVEGKSKSGQVKHPITKHAIKDESDNNEIAGKGSNAGSGSTVEQSVEMAVEDNGGMKRLQSLDHKDAVNVRVTHHIDEYASKTVKGKIQSRIQGRSSAEATDGKDVFFMQQSRPRRAPGPYPRPERDGPYPRPERDITPDRYVGRYRSAAPGDRDGVNQWTSWGSKRRYTTPYQGGEGRNHPRPRSKTGESANKIDGVDYHEPKQTNYFSKGMHRPFMRRSPVERDDYFVGRRIPLTRGVSNYRSRGNYSQRPGRDFGEDFEPMPDDAGASVRMPRYMSRRERSFSPNSGRQTHMTMPRRRSRSRSRTRSPPRAWHPQRERILGARRLSRSPDFRSEARMERMRVPFSKPTFASADYGEGGYISPSRGRFSPQRNCRWVDDRNFSDNPSIRRRRSPPVRVFRRNQRFDAVGSSGRLKSDEYFRPAIRPGRFSFMGNNNGGGRECKFEYNYDDRRRDDSGEMSHQQHQHHHHHHHHRMVHPDDGGNMRRFRHNTGVGGGGDDFEMNNLNNEDNMVRVSTEAKDDGAPSQSQPQPQPQPPLLEEKEAAAASSIPNLT